LTFGVGAVQLSLKTEREKKREKYFPMRKYAIKA
jgi:large subunit ribosomal protein L35e